MKQIVVFQPAGRRIQADPKTNLLELAMLAGINLESTCGGKGICAQCRIKSSDETTPPAPQETELLGESAKKGYRLACQTVLTNGGTVWIPRESLRQHQVILTEGIQVTLGSDPVITTAALSIDSPSLQNPTSSENRLKSALRSQAPVPPAEQTKIPLSIIQDLPAALLRGHGKLLIALRDNSEVIGLSSGWSSDCLGLAVDVGTTTVVVYLLDLRNSQLLGVKADMNPQVQRGDDVIARISFCTRKTGNLQNLGNLILDCINNLATAACREARRPVTQIVECVMVGNTAMHHIALGLNPSGLAQAPYAPIASDALDVKAQQLGLGFAREAWVHWPPVKAGFVGPDLMAVALAVKANLMEKPTLILDLGTNGEMLLTSGTRMVCCSTAAGPAFEGAHITCGMRGAPGAVDRVEISPITFEPKLRVIGDEKPRGLCGSGLVSLVNELVKVGAILCNGSFNPEVCSSRLRPGSNGTEYVFSYAEETALQFDLVLTSQDVAELQLAKGAILAGALVLMHELGVKKISKVVLAGAFGNYLEPQDACGIGLFPEITPDRVEGVGNAAGAGAIMALANRFHRIKAVELAAKMEYFELSTHPLFADLFIEGMIFPEPF